MMRICVYSTSSTNSFAFPVFALHGHLQAMKRKKKKNNEKQVYESCGCVFGVDVLLCEALSQLPWLLDLRENT